MRRQVAIEKVIYSSEEEGACDPTQGHGGKHQG